jgi:two-component system, OmpR family, sensor histidine kinase KdpD
MAAGVRSTAMAQDPSRAGRPDPDELLRHVQAAEHAARRGHLKIFLGYSSGVGKSFRMLDESRRRRRRGEDLVIAALQAALPPEVAAIASALEQIPTLEVGDARVIDVLAVLRRRPQVCLVDGLAHDNPEGSRHAHRYEDVQEILDAGIAVVSSLNLEFIAEEQDFIEQVTGRRRTTLVPQAFVDMADEVVIVDAPHAPEASDPFAGDGAWREQQLGQLRERALLLTADVVERQLESYLELHGVESTWGTQERILVCMTPRANGGAMLASGRRNADRFHGELLAVYVNQQNLTDEDRSALARNVLLARAQEARVEILEGRDPIRAILEFARAEGVTQLYVGHNLQRNWRALLTGSLLDRLIDEADGMDVRVFPH